MKKSLTDTTLEDFFSTLPTGSLDKAMLNNLRGFNHRQADAALPMNREMPGYTFFVRPQLNLQSDNILNVRKMTDLATENMTSIQRHIRTLLDPRLMTGVEFANFSYPAIPCPVTNNRQAFIPFLTNNIISSSGWPSISVPTFTSKPGLYNESYTMVDGRVVNDEVYDITCNFRNVRGDPTLYLFYIWALYMSFVFENKLNPYLDYLVRNDIDYNTRIIRITTDHTRRRIHKISCARVAFPVGVDVGDSLNFSKGKPYSEANQEIPITFRCTGHDIFDSIVAKEFNDAVQIFCPEMSDGLRYQYMVNIPEDFINGFHGMGYPRINMETSELEWWVENDVFNYVVAKQLGGTADDEYEDAQ